MFHNIYLLIFIFTLKLSLSFAQTEGWSTSCASDYPTVSEVMVDACGDEFRSEYLILSTGAKSFDSRNLFVNVINPSNNAFVGSISVQNNSGNANALRQLNDAASATCSYGTVFRDIMQTPYNGVVPPYSVILLFNNKDSTDVSYLSPGMLSRLCGSKVFVVFGTLNPQSRGQSIFRNYPQNGSCGSGCLRQIQFSFEGVNTPYCTQLTYDIKKLPNLNTTNPPPGFNEGAYIRPALGGVLTYGGGNLTGQGLNCMPDTKMLCTIPTMPDYGDGFWNVLAFDGINDYSNNSFKGFYQAKGNYTVSIGTATADNFEFNTRRDGWGGTQAPSEAHTTLGALATYIGCNVRADSFSILAKRKGFDCGFYKINLNYYDDFARIRIDNNGDGVWDFDKAFNNPACSTACGTEVWQGFLSPQSKMEIYAYDQQNNFNIHFLFQKYPNPAPVKIAVTSTSSVACSGAPTGSLTTTVSGGLTPYNITWSSAVPIANGSLSASNLPSGLYLMKVSDAAGCADSAQILVPQTNNITVLAKGDTSFCPNNTAVLRGVVSGGVGTLRTEWLTTTSSNILSTDLNFSPIVSKSTNYVLRATDNNGCFKTDTVTVHVNSLPIVHVSISPNDTVCNDAVPVIRASGAQSYTWSSFPPIGAAALNAQGDSARLFSLFLPAPYYIFTATGTDANGCQNTGQTIVTIIPLPNVTITPVLDTLCDDAAPYPLTVTPSVGGTFFAQTITATAATPCLNCVQNGIFYPNIAGAGTHLINYEIINASGCRNSPSIQIAVKNCKCPTTIRTPLSKNICAGDSLKIKNIFYKTAGTYLDTFRKADGCDSIVILNLKINRPDTTHIAAKTCNPSTVGTNSQIFKNQYGCDSLVITTKTFGRHDTTRYTYLICTGDSVLVNRIWIKTQGETLFRLQNNEGCDSIVIANIAFTRKDTVYRFAKSCDPSRVGTNTLRLTNQSGCDSLVITQTSFSAKDTTLFIKTTCNPTLVGLTTKTLHNILGCDSIILTRTVLQKADSSYSFFQTCNPLDTGIRQLNLKNKNGCDSIVFTETSLKRHDSTRISRFICAGDSLGFDGRWIKAQGIYFETRTNTEGCDSVLVLTLDFWKKDTTFVQASSCNPLLVGTKTHIFKNLKGCDSVVITQTKLLLSNIQESITTSKSISCNGLNDGSLSVKINSGGLAPFSFNWSNGATGSRLDNLRAGRYAVTVTDVLGCVAKDSFVLNEPPPLSINIVGIPPLCYGDKIGRVRIDSVGGGKAPYQLIFNKKTQILNNLPIVVNNISLGIYNFRVIDNANCSFDSTVVVPQADERRLDVGADVTIGLGDSIQIGAFINFRNARFQWTARDGNIRCDTCVPTIVSPQQTTVYKLTVRDTSGCTVSDALTVYVDKRRKVFIPTSFSPNGDGINEHFTLFADHEVRKIETMKIFNRWGSLIFSQDNFLPNDESQGWDGRINGVTAPSDTYVFFVKIEFIDGKILLYQGDVTIVR